MIDFSDEVTRIRVDSWQLLATQEHPTSRWHALVFDFFLAISTATSEVLLNLPS